MESYLRATGCKEKCSRRKREFLDRRQHMQRCSTIQTKSIYRLDWFYKSVWLYVAQVNTIGVAANRSASRMLHLIFDWACSWIYFGPDLYLWSMVCTNLAAYRVVSVLFSFLLHTVLYLGSGRWGSLIVQSLGFSS